MATKKNIGKWLVGAKEEKFKYLIVAVDKFDYSDYPILCKTRTEALDNLNEIRTTQMADAREVYNLNLSIKKQLDERRAWNI